jgi:hypothetical protein
MSYSNDSWDEDKVKDDIIWDFHDDGCLVSSDMVNDEYNNRRREHNKRQYQQKKCWEVDD